MTVDTISSYIDGQWRTERAGHTLEVVSPATEAVVATLREADGDEVDAAVSAARRAFDAGTWSRASVADRQRVLYRIHDLIVAHKDELARRECTNTGIPIKQVLGRHVDRAAHNFAFFAEYIGQAADGVFDQHPDYLTFVRHEPVGVAALIAPWNAPLALACMKIAGAIAFGNSCVVKPSEFTPLEFVPLMDLFGQAGLPDGVVNMVNGRGHVTGQALVDHPGIDAIAFTGGTETGRRIGQAAGRGLKALVTELGGKSANIIFADADLDRALDGALVGIFSNNGQQCLAGSRILIQRPIADAFIDRFVERTRRLSVGDPFDEATEIGPLITRAHFDRVLGYADIARGEGAEVLTGGGRAEGFDRGYYVQPTVMRVPDNSLRVCQEEIFGPFAVIQPFDEPDEAFHIANDTRYGLVSYVWSESLGTVTQAMQRLRSGVVWINTPMTRELRAPFGGFKDSGTGRMGGEASRRLFTEEKTVTLPTRTFPIAKLGLGTG